MRTVLRPYQRVGVKKITRFQGVSLLGDEMGLGKSLTALAYAHQEKLRPIIVVCPASLKWNWEHEAKIHCGWSSTILEGMKPARDAPLMIARVVIVNYDILKAWLPFLLSLQPQLLILDEGHYCKSRKALRTKLARKLARQVKKVIILTGTPITNRPNELWAPLNILRPSLFPSYTLYAQRYCDRKRTLYGWDDSGASNLDELHTVLKKEVMIRRLKKDVLQDLPQEERIIVPFQLADYAKYDKEVTKLRWWLGSHGQRKNVKALQLEKVGRLKRTAAKLKLPAVLDWLDNFLCSTDEKIILFVIHRRILQALYEPHKRYATYVHGGVIGKERQRAFDQFNGDPKCRVLVGNIQAAGVGWNGIAATVVAFAELSYVPGEHLQAEARIHRIGQKKPVRYYYLIARDTIEETQCRLIQRKQAVLEQALDGQPQRQLSVFDDLLRAIRKGN